MTRENQDFETPASKADQRSSEAQDSAPGPVRDQELKSILDCWSAPAVSRNLDDRILASYREKVVRAHQRGWHHILGRFVPLPLPLAATGTLALLLLVLFLGKGWLLQKDKVGAPTRQPAARLEFSAVQEIVEDNSGKGTQYLTYINSSGFRPLQQVRFRIIRKEH